MAEVVGEVVVGCEEVEVEVEVFVGDVGEDAVVLLRARHSSCLCQIGRDVEVGAASGGEVVVGGLVVVVVGGGVVGCWEVEVVVFEVGFGVWGGLCTVLGEVMVVGGVLAGELVKNASVVAWCVRQ